METENILDKAELINEISTAIASKLTAEVKKQLINDVSEVTNEVIKQKEFF